MCIRDRYKREAFELFAQLLDVVKLEVTRVLMTVRIQSQDEAAQAAAALEEQASQLSNITYTCLLYTSDAADERSSVDLGGRRILKKTQNRELLGTAQGTQ